MPFNCVVPNCEDKSSTRHRLPNPAKFLSQFNEWLEVIGRNDIKVMDPLRVYNNFRICHRHFSEDDLSTNMYLTRGAIPTLFLPERRYIPENPEILPLTSKEFSEEIITYSTIPTTSKPSFELSQSGHLQVGAQFLHTLEVSKVSELTRKIQQTYKRTQTLSNSIHRLRLRTKQKNQLSQDEIIENATSNLDPTVANFIKSQFRLKNTKSKGRRFHLDNKILGIILHKQSPECYNLLSKIFALPSRKANMTLLNRIPMKAGINKPVFDNLKISVQNLSPRDRHSILIFDELSIKPQVIANKNLMEFEGFEDSGNNKTSNIADHAAVFFVKGITKKWEKPLVYTFCQSITKTVDLARIIVSIIKECQKAGLKIVATVSDQDCTNVAAVNYLCKNYNSSESSDTIKIYSVNGEPVVHIYDPAHLLKDIRNNLLTKDLIWKKNNEIIRAKWQHIVQTFEDDKESGDLRTLPKITESHIYSNKMKKMKVSIAAQVFSHSMASVMFLMCRKGIAQDPECGQTAEVLKFFDTLFDSVNGATRYESGGKKFKCAVTNSSGHLQYWNETRQELSNMFFIDANGRKTYPPSLKHWKITLNGLTHLFGYLKKFEITYFYPREINQEPIENFFGQLLQHGGCNIIPNCSMFKNYFKTLFINNLISRQSIEANCKKYKNINLIEHVKQLVTQDISEEDRNNDALKMIQNVNVEIKPWTYIDKISLRYIVGFISKYIKTINTCISCKNNIICQNSSEWNDVVLQKKYTKGIPNKLKKFTPQFLEAVTNMYNITLKILPEICKRNKCIYFLQMHLRETIFFKFKFICDHVQDIKKIIIENFSFLICFNWALGLNKVLAMKTFKAGLNDKIYTQVRQYSEKKNKK